MQKTMKKTLSIILAILMIVTTVPFAFAAEGETRTIYVKEEVTGFNFGYEYWFVDADGNDLNCTYEDLGDNWYKYTVPVSAAKYYMWKGIGGGDSYPYEPIPEKVDTLINRNGEAEWYCSHQMNTSGEHNCKGFLCEICGETYGEADLSAHKIKDGICEVCGEADPDAPLIIDVTDKNVVGLGEGARFYDEDGYIITGTNENCDINVYESSNITLRNLSAQSMGINSTDGVFVTINLEGINELAENLTFYKEHIIFEGSDDAIFKADYIYNGGNGEASVTLNGGNIVFESVSRENFTVNCGKLIINGGTLTASNDSFYVTGSSVELNGGELNIISTSQQYPAILKKITMKKGALLTLSAKTRILDNSAEITVADGLAESDNLLVRYDTESEFVPVQDIKVALNGKTYAEIKVDTHVHSYEDSEWNYSTEKHWKKCSCGEIAEEAAHTYTDSKCVCGYECDHAGQTGTCTICGAAIHTCDFSGEWQYDSEKHWKECSCGEIAEEAAHTYTDTKCECGYVCFHPGQTGNTCEYCGAAIHTCDFSGEWKCDIEKHWKECDCGETGEEAEHTYTDGKCVCGKNCTHFNTTDGKCDACGAEIKGQLSITMNDSYGDSWNGNKIQICTVSDGVLTEIANTTVAEGSSYVFEMGMFDGEAYAFRWIKGNFANECSFSIAIDGVTVYESSDCDNFDDNKLIYISCDHNFVNSICSVCGFVCGVDFDHTMNGDECSACGYVCSHVYTNHYCKICGNVEDGYYAGVCGAAKAEDAIWSLGSEGTLTISGEGEYSVPFYDAPWKAYKENIKNVVIEEGITNIPWASFYDLFNAVSLSIPSTVASIDEYGNNSFIEIKLADGNNYYSVVDDVLLNYDKTELIMYPAKKADETYTVPDGVTILSSYAFYLSENLKTVNISDDVTTIKVSCFEYSSVENINFGKNVEVIESNAFARAGLKTVVLPEKLEEISEYLFYGCGSLETLVIGSKVTSIENDIISYCDNIETVHFTGTEEQWQAITKPDNSEDAINTVAVHCGALEEKEAIDATCAEAGHTAGLYCDECNAYLTGEEIPATGEHTYVDGKCECGDECKHPGQTGAECEICGSALHVCDFSGEWNYSDEDHWKECSCGEISAEAEHTFTDGKCDCGYECPHEDTYNNLIRPVQNADGTWGKGKIVKICNTCGNSSLVQEVERDHEGYKVFDETAAELEALLNSGKMTDKWKNDYTNSLNGLRNSAYYQVYTEIETAIPSMTESLKNIIAAIEAGLADGTMIKADFTYMTSLFDEINALIDNDPNKLIPSESGRFQGIYYGYYMSCKNNGNHSQADYDQNMAGNNWEGQIEDILAGVKDGTALKADYTAIDEAIAEIEKKLADENVTDEAKAELEEIKSQLEEKKADGNTSAADLAELEKALDEYEAELDAGIEDGSAVKVDGLEEIVNINDKLNNELAEKFGEEALAEIAEKLDEKFADKFDELYERAEALTGSVAENKDALAEIEAEMEAIFAEAENCLNGTHNGLKFEVTAEAKCGENAIESATCTLCGETVTREVENSALKHSFTKYEVTEEAKCGVAGKKVAACDRGCGATDEKAIAALTHKDADGDYKCDNGCGHEFEKPAPEEPTDKACDHLCHKGGFVGFIWKIVKFFSKLFKINPLCECGAAHY